jgi:hypothetical protein
MRANASASADKKTMRPFGGPNAHKNSDRCKGTEAPCGYCGKAVAEPWPYMVRIVDGGGRFATKREFYDEDPVNEAGDLGASPVGSACAKKLMKAGVFVEKTS